MDKGSEFYNRLTKSWLQDNYIIKSVVAERLIRTLKNKIYKYMTSVSKNVYIDQSSTFLIFFFFVKVLNWSEDDFVIKKVKNTFSWTYVTRDLNGKEIDGTFYQKELHKTNEKEFRIEIVIRRKGDKPHVQWNDYDRFIVNHR